MNGPDILGDILAYDAVTAGGGPDQNAFFIFQNYFQAVNFQLAYVCRNLFPSRFGFYEFFDAFVKIPQVFFRESIVERPLRLRVYKFFELLQGLPPYPLGRRIG